MATVLGVRGFNPIWAEFDLSGNIFDDTFYMYTLQNTIPYIPQAVYSDPTLATELMNPIQFLSNGTLPVDIYWLPNTAYRLEFRQNNGIDPPTQNDPLIYEVDNYIANGQGVVPPENAANTSENEIANPQFAVVNFVSPTTISETNPAPIQIAPGWFLMLAGTGTVVLNQVPLNNLDPNVSNAPYALRMTLTGWNAGETFLVQRFQQNGILWGGKTISSTITASVGVGSASLEANLVDSNGTQLATVLTQPTLNNMFVEYTGSSQSPLPASTNPNVPPAAYIQYQLTLPNNVDLYVTSIQLLVQDPNDLSQPTFVQDTIDRQIDNLFHYYEPGLIYKPIPSMLIGWDFPVNPAQFLSTTITATSSTISTTAGYVWDQTIGQSVVGNVAVVRNSVTGGLQATTANANEAFYLLQYLSGAQAKEILGSTFSININAFTTQSGIANVQVYLFRGSSSATIPSIVSSPSTIGTLVASGVFTLTSSNWTQIIQQNGLGTPSIPLSQISTANYSTINSVVDVSLNSWQVTDATQISNTDKFAIVVTFQCPTSGTVVIVDSISLVPGSIATRPAPKSYSATLVDCQHYFRKSFLPGQVPVNNIPLGSGETYGIQAGTIAGVAGPFVRFDTVMRAIPTVTLFSPFGPSNGLIYNLAVAEQWSACSVNGISQQGFGTIGTPPSSPTPSQTGQQSAVSWTADARLGVV